MDRHTACSSSVTEADAATDEDVTSSVTVIITTSPVPSNPSTTMLETVVGSLALVPGLAPCRKLLCCDGYVVGNTKTHKSANKRGRVTEERAERYVEYIAAVRRLCDAPAATRLPGFA